METLWDAIAKLFGGGMGRPARTAIDFAAGRQGSGRQHCP